MLKKPLFTRKNQDCTAKNKIGNIVFNYRFTGNSRLYICKSLTSLFTFKNHFVLIFFTLLQADTPSAPTYRTLT